MVGRVADDRVGYFTTQYTDIGSANPNAAVSSFPTDTVPRRQQATVDTDVRLIHRWRRPAAGEPCNIIYHIDPNIPFEWREYVHGLHRRNERERERERSGREGGERERRERERERGERERTYLAWERTES
jgi:hypothetical protein